MPWNRGKRSSNLKPIKTSEWIMLRLPGICTLLNSCSTWSHESETQKNKLQNQTSSRPLKNCLRFKGESRLVNLCIEHNRFCCQVVIWKPNGDHFIRYLGMTRVVKLATLIPGCPHASRQKKKSDKKYNRELLREKRLQTQNPAKISKMELMIS